MLKYPIIFVEKSLKKLKIKKNRKRLSKQSTGLIYTNDSKRNYHFDKTCPAIYYVLYTVDRQIDYEIENNKKRV